MFYFSARLCSFILCNYLMTTQLRDPLPPSPPSCDNQISKISLVPSSSTLIPFSLHSTPLPPHPRVPTYYIEEVEHARRRIRASLISWGLNGFDNGLLPSVDSLGYCAAAGSGSAAPPGSTLAAMPVASHQDVLGVGNPDSDLHPKAVYYTKNRTLAPCRHASPNTTLILS